MLQIQCLVFVLMCCGTAAAIPDPCSHYKQLSRAKYRGGKCMRVQNKEVCDRTLPTDWYRATGLAGDLQMQNTVAAFESCGTQWPYWMNGSNPAVVDGVVNRTMCQTTLMQHCSRTTTIQVKNCGLFYVYKLEGLPTCPSGYCFGTNDACPPLDPCDYYENIRIPYDAGRSSACSAYGTTACDDSFDVTKWYSFSDIVDSGRMNVTSQCPAIHGCGTEHPLWVKGYDTAKGEATVCERNQTSCCHRQFTIPSKQCNGFRVYKFPSPAVGTCNRYCIDYPFAICPTTSVTYSTSTKANLPGTTRSPGSTTRGGNGDEGGDHTNSKSNSVKDYMWVFGMVSGVAIAAIVTVTVIVVKVVLPSRARVNKMVPVNAVTPTGEPEKKLPPVSHY